MLLIQFRPRPWGTTSAPPSLPLRRPPSTPPPPTPVPTGQTFGSQRLRWRCGPPPRRSEDGPDPPPSGPHTHPREAAAAAAGGLRRNPGLRSGGGAAALTCGGNWPSFPPSARADGASSLAQAALGWWQPAPDAAPAGRTPRRSERGHADGRRPGTGPRPSAPSSPTPARLTAPAALKATEPHFPAAASGPEPRLRAGPLTPGAGRQRAAAALQFPGLGSGRCGAAGASIFHPGLGGSLPHTRTTQAAVTPLQDAGCGAPTLPHPGSPAGVPPPTQAAGHPHPPSGSPAGSHPLHRWLWVDPRSSSSFLGRRVGVSQVSGDGEPVSTVGTSSGHLTRHQRASSQPSPGPFPSFEISRAREQNQHIA